MNPTSHIPGAAKRNEGGSATLVFLVLLGLMMALAIANMRTLMVLKAEEKLIEHEQVQRLSTATTNVAALHREAGK